MSQTRKSWYLSMKPSFRDYIRRNNGFYSSVTPPLEVKNLSDNTLRDRWDKFYAHPKYTTASWTISHLKMWQRKQLEPIVTRGVLRNALFESNSKIFDLVATSVKLTPDQKKECSRRIEVFRQYRRSKLNGILFLNRIPSPTERM